MPVKELNVEIFEWPDRFFVTAYSDDKWYYRFFPMAEKEEPPPYLVDLELRECDCEDYKRNVEPYLGSSKPHRTLCSHILAAERFRDSLGNERPKELPPPRFV